MWTLGKAVIDRRIQDATGYCDFENNRDMINRAQEELAQSVVREDQREDIVVIAFDSCFALPPQYDSIQAAWSGEFCDGKKLTLRGITYEYSEYGNNQAIGLQKNILQRGTKPTFRMPSFSPFHVFALSEKPERNKSSIVVQGYEANNTQVFTGLHEKLNFQPGERLPISQGRVMRTFEAIDCDNCTELEQIVFTKEAFTDITALLKRDADNMPYFSNGYIYIYAFCPSTLKIQMISYIHPMMTEAEFRQYRIPAFCDNACRKVHMQVTKRFIPAYHPDDVLFIQNISALEAMIRHIRARLANEFDKASYELTRAQALYEGRELRQQRFAQTTVKPFWMRGMKQKVR